MYPYKRYDAGEGMMIYNDDGTTENRIYIELDKQIKGLPCCHVFDIIYTLYHKNSMECVDTITTIVNNCMMECDYVIAERLLGYFNTIRRNAEMW